MIPQRTLRSLYTYQLSHSARWLVTDVSTQRIGPVFCRLDADSSLTSLSFKMKRIGCPKTTVKKPRYERNKMNENFNYNKTKAFNFPYVEITLWCIWCSWWDFHKRLHQFQASRIIYVQRGYKSVRVVTISHLNRGFRRSPKGLLNSTQP